MKMTKAVKKYMTVSVFVAGSFLSGQAFANAQMCSNVQYSPTDDTQLHVLTQLEPELVQPAPQQNTKKDKKKSEQSVSWFSWLTESHTMPSLHFIDILELFGGDE